MDRSINFFFLEIIVCEFEVVILSWIRLKAFKLDIEIKNRYCNDLEKNCNALQTVENVNSNLRPVELITANTYTEITVSMKFTFTLFQPIILHANDEIMEKECL